MTDFSRRIDEVMDGLSETGADPSACLEAHILLLQMYDLIKRCAHSLDNMDFVRHDNISFMSEYNGEWVEEE